MNAEDFIKLAEYIKEIMFLKKAAAINVLKIIYMQY